MTYAVTNLGIKFVWSLSLCSLIRDGDYTWQVRVDKTCKLALHVIRAASAVAVKRGAKVKYICF